MKRVYFGLFFLLATVLLLQSSCSSSIYKKAHVYHKSNWYDKAAPLYERLHKRNYKPSSVVPGLIECYQETFQLDKAELLLSDIVHKDTNNIAARYNYASILRMNGKCKDANVWYRNYLQGLGSNVNQSEDFCNLRERTVEKDYQAIVKPLVIPGKEDVYSAIDDGDGFIFLAPQEAFGKNPSLYYDLYHATLDKNGTVASIKALKGKVNSPFQEGPASLSKSGDELYFTRSNYQDRKLVDYEEGDNEWKTKAENTSIQNNLMIFKSHRNGVEWERPVAFEYNNNAYSTGHPALSADGNVLYFVSDMPGGFGGTDLYACTKTAKGWGTPKNLGAGINTSFNESFPFSFSDESGSRLFFTSDRKNGLGGRDVYMAEVRAEGMSAPQLLPAPLNSYFDDFGLSFDQTGQAGMVASNRLSGQGKNQDALFEVKLLPRIYIKGKMISGRDQLPIKNAAVQIIPQSKSAKAIQTKTDSEGNYLAELELEQQYNLKVKVDSFYAYEYSFNTMGKKRPETISSDVTLEHEAIELQPILVEVPVEIPNIYFAFDKWDLLKISKQQLGYVIKMMNDNPELSIELSSYTDSRGPAIYNQFLSDKRAESVALYIQSAGIAANRITSKGYGETALLNNCGDNVKCSKKEHAQNRRTTFRVTRIVYQ